jgi:hypothetical protein
MAEMMQQHADQQAMRQAAQQSHGQILKRQAQPLLLAHSQDNHISQTKSQQPAQMAAMMLQHADQQAMIQAAQHQPAAMV